MTGPTRRQIEKWLDRLEGDGDRDRVNVGPEHARRIEWAFEQWGGVDAERLAHLYTYGPAGDDDGELDDDEAEAVRAVEWEEQFGEAPPREGES